MTQSARQSDLRRVFVGPREPRAGWRLLLFLAMIIALSHIGNLLLGRLLHGVDDSAVFLVRELMDLLIFLLASRIMGRIEGRTIGDYGLPWRQMFRARFWRGALVGFASLTSLLLAMRVVGAFRFGTIALHGIDIAKWAVVWALVFTLVALREEFRARGYGLFTLSMGIGFWPAATLSAAYFAFTHLGSAGESGLGPVNAFLFGLVTCLFLRRTGNLWMAIGFHAAFDWGETFFYGVADSGQALPGHLLAASASAPTWLSGGAVGPEGSALCSLLLVVVFVVSAVRRRSTPATGR